MAPTKKNADEVEKVPLTENEQAYNRKVLELLIEPMVGMRKMMEESFKPKQFGSLANAKSVYGPLSANKSEVGKLISHYAKLTEHLRDLLIEEETIKEASGYSHPVFIDKRLAPMVGLAEGTPLWPHGGYPVLTSAIFSAWTSNYSFLNNLNLGGKGNRFKCDNFMRQFIGQFHGADAGSDSKGVKLPPFDLDCLDFPKLGKIFKHFVLRGGDGKNVVVNMPDGSDLERAYKDICVFYEDLKQKKETVKKNKLKIEHAENDLSKTVKDAQAGIVPQSFVQKNQGLLLQAQKEYENSFHLYKQTAQAMGIPIHVQ